MTTRPGFFGLHLPCKYVRARDGDTIEVQILSGLTWAIRLIGVNCFERYTGEGKAATKFVKDVLEEADDLSVWLPAPKHAENLLKNLTFDRVPGHVFVGESNLADMIVHAGHGAYTHAR